MSSTNDINQAMKSGWNSTIYSQTYSLMPHDLKVWWRFGHKMRNASEYEWQDTIVSMPESMLL